jgi:hypothetical protein
MFTGVLARVVYELCTSEYDWVFDGFPLGWHPLLAQNCGSEPPKVTKFQCKFFRSGEITYIRK